MDLFDFLLEEYPIRHTGKQKSAFLRYLKTFSEKQGIPCQELCRGSSRSILLGNPTDARLIVTVCYETPMKTLFPYSVYPAAPLLTRIGQRLPILLAVFLFPVLSVCVVHRLFLHLLTILFLLFILLFTVRLFWGPSNRENQNCYTAAVAVVLQFMCSLTTRERQKAAVLFWDCPDRKLSGLDFARRRIGRPDVPYLHLSCVGDGDCFFLLRKKCTAPTLTENTFRVCLKRAALEWEKRVMSSETRHGVLVRKLGQNDTELCCINREALLGGCIRKLRTGKDTVTDGNNLAIVANALKAMIMKL